MQEDDERLQAGKKDLVLKYHWARTYQRKIGALTRFLLAIRLIAVCVQQVQ